MYSYDDMLRDIKTIKNCQKLSIGKSYFGRDIIAIITGSEKPKVLIHGAIHAREYITTKLIIEQIKQFLNCPICYVPMVNPDGVQLVTKGIKSVPDNAVDFLTAVNKGLDFSLWKANGRAVDLNVNFNADWGMGKYNIKKPSSENYIGMFPESESEVQSLIELSKKFKFCVSISYHIKGEVIYCGYNKVFPFHNQAVKISKSTGYPLLESEGSAGGYKDWFILNNFGLGLTVEVGDDRLSHPITLKSFSRIWQQNKNIPKITTEIAEEIWTKNI